MSRLQLGVNIDHVATVRQARGTIYPDPIRAALLAEKAGADAITLHLREDRRHIQDRDVEILRHRLKTRMNMESALTQEMLRIALRIKPQDVCLVPEKREELTTEGGLDVTREFNRIKRACKLLSDSNIQVSLFIDADFKQIDAAKAVGAPVVEIHTGCYADATSSKARKAELARIQKAVSYAAQQGFKVNAGHGLNYDNVRSIAAIPEIAELNIGHAIVAHALFVGWENAVREMKRLMLQARKGR